MMAKKVKAPQDATMRNVRAARGRADKMSKRLAKLEHSVALLAVSVAALAHVMERGKR
jgi:hypothetical protein